MLSNNCHVFEEGGGGGGGGGLADFISSRDEQMCMDFAYNTDKFKTPENSIRDAVLHSLGK